MPDADTSLADKVVALHRALDDAGLAHAFGGALALAWCTRQARGTSDIDVNVFVPPSSASAVLAALPAPVRWDQADLQMLERDGQRRLRWKSTPVDLFLNTDAFHVDAMARASLEPFAGEMLPFLACADLAVFKLFFNRRRDWADLEDMLAAGSLDAASVADIFADLLGCDDQRVVQFRRLADEVG